MRIDSLHCKSLHKSFGLKIFVHFVAECLFDVSKVVFMFNNHRVTLKFTQKLVS